MILDLENERTWPNELITILKTRAITLKIERDAELQAADDGSRWFNPPKTPVTNQTIEEISRLIKSLKIRAYHCTRMLEPEKVFTTGLRILTPIMHKEIL